MEDGLLTIQGERQFTQESSEQQFHRVERRYGAFRRSITLPAHVTAEGIQASFEDGVLQILVPKAEEAKPKRIQVRPGRMEVTAASRKAQAARRQRPGKSNRGRRGRLRPPGSTRCLGRLHSDDNRAAAARP